MFQRIHSSSTVCLGLYQSAIFICWVRILYPFHLPIMGPTEHKVNSYLIGFHPLAKEKVINPSSCIIEFSCNDWLHNGTGVLCIIL